MEEDQIWSEKLLYVYFVRIPCLTIGQAMLLRFGLPLTHAAENEITLQVIYTTSGCVR